MSSIDQLLSWLDDVITDAELALRDEQAGLQIVATELDESRRFAEANAGCGGYTVRRRRNDASGRTRSSQNTAELVTRLDIELAVDLAQVVRDGVRTDVELCRNRTV